MLYIGCLFCFSGLTAANRAKILQGQQDIELCDFGRCQAHRLAHHFETLNVKFDFVFSSDLSRAYETCQIVVDGSGNEVVVDNRLRERGYGNLEGKSVDVLRDEAKKAGFDHRTYGAFTPKGAESLTEVKDRVQSFLNHLTGVVRPGQHVLVVTHGGVIREFIRNFRDRLRCDLSEKEPLKVTPNTGVNVFRICYNPSGKLLIADCLKMHDVTHLESLVDQIEDVAKDTISVMSDGVPLEAL